jgi:hypothetical protein
LCLTKLFTSSRFITAHGDRSGSYDGSSPTWHAADGGACHYERRRG